VEINFDDLSEKLPAKFSEMLKVAGKSKLGWKFSGRLPDESEIKNLTTASSFDLEKDIRFLDMLEAYFLMQDIGVDLALGDDKFLNIKSVYTDPPLQYSFNQNTGKGKMDGGIFVENAEIKDIGDAPSGNFKKPLKANLSFSGEHDYLKSFNFSQAITLDPINIKETFNLNLSGLESLLEPDIKLPLLLKRIGGTAKWTANLTGKPDITGIIDNLDIDGNLEASLALKIVPDKNINAEILADVSGMNVVMGKQLSVNNLNLDLDLEKNYSIISGKKKNEQQSSKKNIPLSVRVMRAESDSTTIRSPLSGTSGTNNISQRFISKIEKRLNTEHTVTFKSAHVEAGPIPLDIEHSNIDFYLNKGLPEAEYFRFDLLGGTLTGSIAVTEKDSQFFLQLMLMFSGIDFSKIFPDTEFDSENKDAEVSGQLMVFVPMLSNLDLLLQGLELDLKFTHISSRALERLLYALDPSESDESIVSQRTILRIGSPKQINITVKDGFFSLTGEIDAAGVSIKIPKIERVDITKVAGLEKYEEHLASLDSVVEILKITSANVIKILPNQNDIKFETINEE